MEEVRTAMEEAFQDILPEREICPGWTVRDVLAHITGWDQVALKALQSFQMGGSPFLIEPLDIDGWNEKFVQQRKDMSLEQVKEEFRQVRSALVEQVRSLGTEALEQELVYPWGPEGTVREMVQVLIEHEAWHTHEIREMLEEGG